MFNKTPELSDFSDPELRRLAMDRMHAPPNEWDGVNRKWWEWAMVLRAAEHYGFLERDKVALGLGSGFEPPMFALANALRMTVATDLYGQTAFAGHEAQASMLSDPGEHSRFDFDRCGLLVARMDACEIPYADRSFDFLYSCSSLEHFGSSDKVLRAMCEAHRVLRRGGIYAISVDYLYHSPQAQTPRDRRRGPLAEFFTEDEVMRLVVDGPGFALDEVIDFRVDRTREVNVFDLRSMRPDSGEYMPHVWLRHGESYLTSLFLVLFKE